MEQTSIKKKIEIWLIGNTGLRNPARIRDGFRAFAKSNFVGKLHGRDNEVGFMNFLNDQGVIQNSGGKDITGSHARKWRLMFERYGLIYGQAKGKGFEQRDLGPLDEITSFGRDFLKADTFPAEQECFLRSLGVEQYKMPADSNGKERLFSPFRWILAIMLELERRTGSSELGRLEFALWGQTTNPSNDLDDVVDHILDLRKRRETAPAKRAFDKKEIKARAECYSKKSSNFTDYCDMNMRYLRISGVLQRKGRGITLVPSKHVVAEQMASTGYSTDSLLNKLIELANGAPLPTDNYEVAQKVFKSLQQQLDERHILYDLSDLDLSSVNSCNIARRRLENALSKTNELRYAAEQPQQWREIAEYMTLLIRGGGQKDLDDDNYIEVPKSETPAYLEWVLWRAILAIGELINKPYEIRGFKLDSDFLPVSAAGGGKGDLNCEYEDRFLLTEVTMSTSSRQEAMEGEPVRRHVSDACFKYDKPVLGLFIATKIDTNTAETFRHGVWYVKNDCYQRLNILPLTLEQFRDYFCWMFESRHANPSSIFGLIQACTEIRDDCDAPRWKKQISETVAARIADQNS